MNTLSTREDFFFSGSYISELVSSWGDYMHKLLPEEEQLNFEGQEFPEFHPNLWNFIYSHHLYLAIFVNVLNNRINAIVAPRNPRPLPFTTRLFLRLPCFFLMLKSALVLISRIAGEIPWLQKYVAESVLGYSLDYTDHQALWLCLKALSAVYIMKAFHSSLENRNLPGREQATNLYEWALLFHLYASNFHSNIDLLIIALLELVDALVLEILYIHPHGTQYRLIPTTIIGIIGIGHLAHALRYSETYPLLQSVARFPELALICVIIMCTILHGIAIIATGGNLRGRFFLDARSLPSLNQDYTMALYSIGMACIEATRTDGYRNEMNPIAVPMGTVFETSRRRRKSNRRRPTCGYDNEQLEINGTTASQEPDDNPLRLTVMTNFAISLIQAAADCGAWVLDRLPIPFLARGNNNSQELMEGSPQVRLEHHNIADGFDSDADLYARFLQNEDLDDEDDDEYKENDIPNHESESDSEDDESQDVYNELISLGNDIREQEQTQSLSSHPSASILQLFLTHLMHTPTLTRTQYRHLTERPPVSSAAQENSALLALIQQRREIGEIKQPITDRLCVICHAEPRQCLLKPCSCFAMCNECREVMAQKRFKTCPCCRRPVEGWCRIYVP
ncbi:hypothetical protein G9A89_008812 [Geosiphon pyriformis]|nr:hypothetical protein G9A89_008812 [Geosiphon pyriformis]